MIKVIVLKLLASMSNALVKLHQEIKKVAIVIAES